MDWDTATDIARALDIVLSGAVLVLLNRALQQRSHMWAPKLMGIFRFLNLLVLLVFLGLMEKIHADSEPAIAPFLFAPVFAFGVIAIYREGPYEK